jgi:hypothetical protein
MSEFSFCITAFGVLEGVKSQNHNFPKQKLKDITSGSRRVFKEVTAFGKNSKVFSFAI